MRNSSLEQEHYYDGAPLNCKPTKRESTYNNKNDVSLRTEVISYAS